MMPRRLVPLLPLALHALHSVRRAAARVLALTVFGAAAAQWQNFDQAAAAAAAASDGAGQDRITSSSQPAAAPGCGQVPTAQGCHQTHWPLLLREGATGVLLPGAFHQQYRFPFKVQPLPISAAAASEAGPGGDLAKQQQQQQQNQRLCVRHLVEQQQLLQAAANKPAAARQLLQDCLPPELQHLSHRVISATANQVFNVDPSAVAERLLAAVAASCSHEECEKALQQLQVLGSSSRGLAAVAAAGSSSWQAAFGRLLDAAPVTDDDQRLWLQLLGLLERLLASSPLPQVGPSPGPRQQGKTVAAAAGLQGVSLRVMMDTAALYCQAHTAPVLPGTHCLLYCLALHVMHHQAVS
jgi:hypothetical protein